MTRIVITLLLCLICSFLQAQTTAEQKEKSVQLPEKYLEKISSQSKSLEQKLDKKSNKALAQLQKQEARMKKKLTKIDSVTSKNVFANANEKYNELEQKLNNPLLKQYIPGLDTLTTSLKFLEKNPQLFNADLKEKLSKASSSVNKLTSQLQHAEDVKQFLHERKEFLKQQLGKFGFAKELKKLSKQAYYYSQQLQEYKAILNDSKKIQRKAIELLSKSKLFNDFIRTNSMLASLFPMPTGVFNGSTAQMGFAGLQTRSQVIYFLQNQSGMNSSYLPSVLQKNIQSAQGIVDQLRNKLNGYGSGDLEMPDFKPNNQKTKSFKKRLELGTNLQTQKSNYFFPTTTDFGLSIGYKLNDKSVLGFGSSFKIGWGKNVQQISVSGEGISLRSFADIKIHNSFYASGGFEYNYQNSFTEVRSLYDLATWKKSALLGISKIISLKGKFFKKTKLQLLYDLLYKQSLPITQPLKFRIGYVF